MKIKIKKSIPNIITSTRLLAVFIGFILICNNHLILGVILYIYGALSDMLDGYLARRLNAYSKLGQYLDAISDKLYFFSVMILSIIYSNYLIIVPAILEVVIASINFMIVLKKKKVFTERVGKFKMTSEFIMIIISLASIKLGFLFYISIILLLITMYLQIQTIFAYINQLNGKSKEEKVDLSNLSIIKKSKYLMNEFLEYLLHPVGLK